MTTILQHNTSAAGVGAMSPPPPRPSSPAPPAAASHHLYKQNSWSHRDEAWLRQKGRRKRRSRSVTEEDLDELKACIELGFDFDSPEMDKRLSQTFPAYGLYYAVNNAAARNSSSYHSPHAIIRSGNMLLFSLAFIYFYKFNILSIPITKLDHIYVNKMKLH